LPITPTIW